VRHWFDKHLSRGLAFGYFSELSKTVLDVGFSDQHRATDIFTDLSVRVVTGSHSWRVSWDANLFLRKFRFGVAVLSSSLMLL